MSKEISEYLVAIHKAIIDGFKQNIKIFKEILDKHPPAENLIKLFNNDGDRMESNTQWQVYKRFYSQLSDYIIQEEWILDKLEEKTTDLINKTSNNEENIH